MKDEITGIQKLINSVISMAEENGGELIGYAVRLVYSITCSVHFSMLEGNVVRLLEFSKAVVLYCPDFEAKNTGNQAGTLSPIGMTLMRYVFCHMNELTNQFLREILPKFKEYVYFHLDLIKEETMVGEPFLLLNRSPSSPQSSLLSVPWLCRSSLLSSRSFPTSNPSLYPFLSLFSQYPLFDNLSSSVRMQATLVCAALTRVSLLSPSSYSVTNPPSCGRRLSSTHSPPSHTHLPRSRAP